MAISVFLSSVLHTALFAVIGPLLLAILGAVAYSVKGTLRTVLVVLNLVDIAAFIFIYYGLLHYSQPITWASGAPIFGIVSVGAGLALFALLLWLERIPQQVEKLLPARGIHGRKFLASLAMLLFFEPVFYLTYLSLQGRRMDANGIISPPLTIGIIILFTPYFLPFRDVLIHGWSPDQESESSA